MTTTDPTSLAMRAEIDRLHAVANAADGPRPACPPWCTLHPGHGWDSTETATGRDLRGHSGPEFGIVDAGAREYRDNGEMVFYIGLEPEQVWDLSPAKARQVAADLTSAAAWVETAQASTV